MGEGQRGTARWEEAGGNAEGDQNRDVGLGGEEKDTNKTERGRDSLRTHP